MLQPKPRYLKCFSSPAPLKNTSLATSTNLRLSKSRRNAVVCRRPTPSRCFVKVALKKRRSRLHFDKNWILRVSRIRKSEYRERRWFWVVLGQFLSDFLTDGEPRIASWLGSKFIFSCTADVNPRKVGFWVENPCTHKRFPKPVNTHNLPVHKHRQNQSKKRGFWSRIEGVQCVPVGGGAKVPDGLGRFQIWKNWCTWHCYALAVVDTTKLIFFQKRLKLVGFGCSRYIVLWFCCSCLFFFPF